MSAAVTRYVRFVPGTAVEIVRDDPSLADDVDGRVLTRRLLGRLWFLALVVATTSLPRALAHLVYRVELAFRLPLCFGLGLGSLMKARSARGMI